MRNQIVAFAHGFDWPLWYSNSHITSCNWKKACGRLTLSFYFNYGGVGYEV